MLTIRCKLFTDQDLAEDLLKTCEAFAEGCNHILQLASEKKTKNALQLHRLSYHVMREKYHLSANLAVRAIRRVSAAFSKKKRPRHFKPTSVSYDARIFSFFEENYSVSLKTLQGRKKIFLDIGDYQKKALIGQKPTAATLVRRGKEWYFDICVERESFSVRGETMGIDLGLKNIAYTNTGLFFSGEKRQAFKLKQAQIRASLQSKNTRGAKQRLKKLSGYEKRRIRHDNHVLSKQLVDEAIRHNCGTIRMEQLKAIREKTKVWNKHRNRMMAGWSFYQLQHFVEYKAKCAGITIEYVSPAYTSQTCYRCGCLGNRHKDCFKCTTCGESPADWNAAWMIAKGGASVNRPELTVCV